MTIDAQIKEIDGIIAQLIQAAASGAPQAQIRRYRIDSGQSVVETERYAAAPARGTNAKALVNEASRAQQELATHVQHPFLAQSSSGSVCGRT